MLIQHAFQMIHVFIALICTQHILIDLDGILVEI